MITVKKIILLAFFAVLVATPIFTVTSSQVSYAAAKTITDPKDCEKTFLGIHPWFRGLSAIDDGKCVIATPGSSFNGKTLDLTGFVWRIALNIIDIGLAGVGYIAFFFILYGGFQFLTGGNNPSQIEKARKTILNAIVGLIISLGAVAVINLVFGLIG